MFVNWYHRNTNNISKNFETWYEYSHILRFFWKVSKLKKSLNQHKTKQNKKEKTNLLKYSFFGICVLKTNKRKTNNEKNDTRKIEKNVFFLYSFFTIKIHTKVVWNQYIQLCVVYCVIIIFFYIHFIILMFAMSARVIILLSLIYYFSKQFEFVLCLCDW